MIPRGALDQLKGDERKMVDESMHAGKAALIESKIKQIKKILMEKDVTFGVAKAVIHAVEAELLEAGDVFLNKEAIINVIGNLEGQPNNVDCPSSVYQTVVLGPGVSAALNNPMDGQLELGHLDCRQLLDKQENRQQCHCEGLSDKAELHLYASAGAVLDKSAERVPHFGFSKDTV